MNLFKKNFSIFAIVAFISSCGGGNSNDMDTTSLQFNLPLINGISLSDEEIDITFSVDGKNCTLDLEKKIVDCGEMEISKRIYSMEVKEKSTNLTLAISKGNFTVEINKRNIVSPVLSYKITQANSSETNYKLFIDKKFPNTTISFPLPYPKDTGNFIDEMDVLITVNDSICLADWDSKLVVCDGIENFGISKDNLTIAYEISYRDKLSDFLLASKKDTFNVSIGRTNIIQVELDTSANSNGNLKNNLNEFLESFGQNWNQLHWNRGKWAE